jgi:hypothetical protein
MENTPDQATKFDKKAYAKLWREKNKEKIAAQLKAWNEKNKEYVRAKKKVYREKHKEKLAKNKKEWAEKNKERLREKARLAHLQNKTRNNARTKAWLKANKVQVREKKREYERHRYQTNPNFAMAIRLRARLRAALKVQKTSKSEALWSLLGCSIPQLKAYLESAFLPGMSWENRNQWHIDHIQPLASFDLADPNQRARACHYTNLQPLWAVDNIRKGAKAPETVRVA